VEQLTRALAWAGMKPDDGPGNDRSSQGDFGPYTQSARLPLYHSHIQTLLKQGDAYPCFCTAERLDQLRQLQTKRGLTPMYDRLCLNMTVEERERKMEEYKKEGKPFVIRMKIPHGSSTIKDMIRGTVVFPNKTLDDQVLLKSDGYPTYHFANVVDDHLMHVTHVIRGVEWLTSTPKHVILYKMFGWPIPHFAHLPLLLKSDGTKLSKRQSDASMDFYIEAGYLPEALINFVAMLGWNPGTTQEVFDSMEELAKAFDLSRIQKAGAVVNREKLDWFNQQHLQRMATNDIEKLKTMVKPLFMQYYRTVAAAPSTSSSETSSPTSAPTSSSSLLGTCPSSSSVSDSDLNDDAFLTRIIYSLVAHVTHLRDFVRESTFYFITPTYQDEQATHLQELKKKVYPDEKAIELNKRLIALTVEELSSLPDSAFIVTGPPPSTSAKKPATKGDKQNGSTAASASSSSSSEPPTPTIFDALKRVVKNAGIKQKTLFLLLRYILTGSESGPGVGVLISTFGRERTLQRLRNEQAYTPTLPL